MREMRGGVGLARRVSDGDAMKVYDLRLAACHAYCFSKAQQHSKLINIDCI